MAMKKNIRSCLFAFLAGVILLFLALSFAAHLLRPQPPEIDNPDELRMVCALLCENVLKEDSGVYSSWPPFSDPAISNLHPQFVTIPDRPPRCVDIQLQGGFLHQGLIVFLNPEDATETAAKDFHPRGWTTRRLFPGIFWYSE